MLHPSTVPISNVELKGLSKVYHSLYNNSAGEILCPNANVQKNSWEKYAGSYIMFI